MRNVDHWRAKCYAQVPPRMYQQLKDFRENHPYKKLKIGIHEWNYIDCGDAQEVLLILTGATGTGESNWESIIRHSGSFRVISPSYPPVGNMDRMIEGLRAILEAENIERVHIVGGSLGSAIGHAFIRRYPERVGKLVLLSYGLPDAGLVKVVRSTIRSLSLIPWPLVKRSMLKGQRELLAAQPGDKALFKQAYSRDLFENDMNKKTMIGHFNLVLDAALNQDQLKMNEPLDGEGRVFIVQAGDDEYYNPKQQKALLDTYPGARTHLFEEGGHLVTVTREKEVDKMIDDFFQP